MRPLALARKNWLFVGSQQAGKRAAVVMSLIESAKLNGHDPWAYLKVDFERLPTLKHRDLRPTAATQLAPSDRDRRHRAHHDAPTHRRVVPVFNTPSSTAQGCGSRNVYTQSTWEEK